MKTSLSFASILRAPGAMLAGLAALASMPSIAPAAPAGAVTQIAYNHPGLITDLGVGLWAWPLPMDWNEDGLMDLVVACTDTPSNGVYVFLNTGEYDPVTRLPLFGPGDNIGPAGKGPSPQVSYIDGQPMVTTKGAYYPDFRNSGLAHPVTLGDPTAIHIGEGNVRANQWKFVDHDGDGDLDLAVGIGFWGDYGWDDAWDQDGTWTNGPLHGYVYLLENTGTTADPVYGEPSKLTTIEGNPLDVYGMPSPSFEDFDQDGDLDILCGEFVDGFTYFENVGTRTTPRYAAGRELMVGGKPLKMELCMITPVAVDFNGDGVLDLVVGDEDGRVAFIEGTGALVDGVPQFLTPRYFRQRADALKFGALSAPVSVDWDGDGLEDLIVGDTAGHIGFIKNLGGDTPRWAAPVYLAAGDEVLREMAGPNGSIQGPAEAKWGYTNPSVGDWDGDGLLDVVTNGIWGKILLYRNVGTVTAPRLAAAEPIKVAWSGETPKPSWVWWTPEPGALVTQWRTTPQLIDWNQDGLLDLVMLDPDGYLAFFERSRTPDGALVLQAPQRIFRGEGVSEFDSKGRPVNEVSGLLRLNSRDAGGSGRRTFTFFDWDRDGQLDLLVNSDTNINVLRGLGRDAAGLWSFQDDGPVSTTRLAAHSTTPTVAHWGDREVLVIGAEDGHFYSLSLQP
ncbi:FG-GAP repeat domain-containing protein [Synoicihabitans lomoniglobus]|uniref:VCBS repeat-containing protein n=1 Tax=Synoicihabitans lomoniglobus TaxID=2909285 RepID=A0AAE9ZYA3_9BACT|nr:VCBS repeat-containing protein [Opitutaceae bacterium LMO-M01]WED63403.1 VCBS repeat-containing protein [Opitutaceae bacterium LMO-M01]